jgi:hypothetical protein
MVLAVLNRLHPRHSASVVYCPAIARKASHIWRERTSLMKLFTITLEDDTVSVQAGIEITSAHSILHRVRLPYQHLRLGYYDISDGENYGHGEEGDFKDIPLGSRDFPDPISRLFDATLLEPSRGKKYRDGSNRLLFTAPHRRGKYQHSNVLLRIIGAWDYTGTNYALVPCEYRRKHSVLAEVRKDTHCERCNQLFAPGYWHPDAGEMGVWETLGEQHTHTFTDAKYWLHEGRENLISLGGGMMRIKFPKQELYVHWSNGLLRHGTRSKVLGERGALSCNHAIGRSKKCRHCPFLVPVRDEANMRPLSKSTCPGCGIEYVIEFN